jgi:hypothetical protein
MSEQPVYRALRSKPAGSYSEYSVIAATREPMSPRSYLRLLRVIAADNPPNSPTGPHALPWITFAGFGVSHDRRFQGVAVTDWSGNADAGGRPIMQTAYFCVPDRPDVRDAGLTGMYELMGGIPPDWNHPDPMDLEPGKATLHPREIHLRAAEVTALGVERAAAAAGALLAGQRVVVELRPDGLDLSEKVRVLDAVVSLLPAGARTWLYSATWSSFDEGAGIHLAFGLPRADAYRLRWTSVETPPGEGDIYRQALQRLAAKHGLERVISELGAAHAQTDRSVEAGLISLRGLDLVGDVLRRLRAGDVDLEAAERVISSGEVGELSATAQREFLSLLVGALAPSNLGLVEPLWTEAAFPILTQLTRSRLWASDWSFADLDRLFDLARRRWEHRRADFFAEVLATPRDASLDRRRRAATVLVQRIPDPGAEPWLGAVFAAHHMLAIDVAVLQLYAPHPGMASRWVEVIARSTTGDGQPKMAVLAVLSFVFGQTSIAPSVRDFTKLAESDPSAAGAPTLEICRREASLRSFEIFLAEVAVPWLHRSIQHLNQAQRDRWRAALDEDRPSFSTAADLARWDLVSLRLNSTPPSLAERASKLEKRQFAEYSAALGDQLDQVPVDRPTAVTRIAELLPPGWSGDERVVDLVLQALRTLLPDPKANPDPPELEFLLTMLVAEDDRFDRVHRARAFDLWQRDLDRYPHLRLRGLKEQLGRINPGTPLEQVDHLVAELLLAEMPDDEVLRGLRERGVNSFGDRLPERLEHLIGSFDQLMDGPGSGARRERLTRFYAAVLGGDSFRLSPADALQRTEALGRRHLQQAVGLLEITSLRAEQRFPSEQVEALREAIRNAQAGLDRVADQLTPRGLLGRTFDRISGKGRG